MSSRHYAYWRETGEERRARELAQAVLDRAPREWAETWRAVERRERERRYYVANARRGEAMSDDPWFWLSFADDRLAKGERFLGVAIVQAASFRRAALRAHELGINPGGEVAVAEIPPGLLPQPDVRDRLLNRGQAAAVAEWMDERRHLA